MFYSSHILSVPGWADIKTGWPFFSTKLQQLDNLFQLSFSVPSPSVALLSTFPSLPPLPSPVTFEVYFYLPSCFLSRAPCFSELSLALLLHVKCSPRYQVAQQYRWPLFISAILRTLSHLSGAAVFRRNLSVNYARTETQKMLFFIFVCCREMACCFAQARKVNSVRKPMNQKLDNVRSLLCWHSTVAFFKEFLSLLVIQTLIFTVKLCLNTIFMILKL